MLDIIRRNIMGTPLEQRIEQHQSSFESIGVTEKTDFILAFYMIHEVKDQKKFIEELASILKPDGMILIIEPKFHVSKKAFGATVDSLKGLGFTVVDSPKVFFSRAAAMKKFG
jgi:2-polyprenyl-3-methyl-5-hydroxy-6-metoxy-1,4-benzoquinol methylase